MRDFKPVPFAVTQPEDEMTKPIAAAQQKESMVSNTNGIRLLEKEPVTHSSMRFQLEDGRIITITAKLMSAAEAQQMLSFNTRNRSMNAKAAADIAADINDGAWHFTGDTIKLATGPDGTFLADAQHRLAGIAMSGTPGVPVIIVENLDPEVTNTIDQGRPRKVGDILRMTYGHADLKNETIISGIASLLMWGYDGNNSPTRRDIADYAHNNLEKLQPWATWARATSDETLKVPLAGRSASAMTASPMGALAIWMTDNGADYELVTDFFWRIATGLISESDKSNVIPALRKRQSNGVPLARIAGGGSSASMVCTEFAVYINAYNRWVTGEAVSVIKGQKQVIKSFAELPAVSKFGR